MGSTFSLGLGLSDESGAPLLLVFRAVLLEELEEHIGLVFIEGSLELSDDWRDLDPGEEDPLLPLEGNVLGPPDKSGEIPPGLDAVANSIITGLGLEEGVSLLVGLLDGSLVALLDLRY